MRCHGNGNSALTCSTMTWLRWFLRLAMKPTCIQPQRLAVSTAALACTEAQNVTYPTGIALLQYVLQIHCLALMTRGHKLFDCAHGRICKSSGALGNGRAARRL